MATYAFYSIHYGNVYKMSSRLDVENLILGNPLGVQYGGSNITSYTVGDMTYADTIDHLTTLPSMVIN